MIGRAAAMAMLACAAVGCLSASLPKELPAQRGLPGALDIGFDAPEEFTSARVGDRVVIEVRAVTRRGPVVRYVDLEVVSGPATLRQTADGHFVPVDEGNEADLPWPSARAVSMTSEEDWVGWASQSGVLQVTTHDEDGTALATRRVTSRLLVAAGVEGEAVRAEALTPGLDDLLRLVLTVPELDALLQDIAQRPPLWTLLRGLSITLDVGEDSARYDAETRAMTLDARLDANGSPAILGKLSYGQKASPYLLTAGVRRIAAHHPSRPELQVGLELVGARRGKGTPLLTGRSGPFSEVPNGRFAIDPPTAPSRRGGIDGKTSSGEMLEEPEAR